MTEIKRYNMFGRLIEFNPALNAWTWSRWDYINTGGRRLVARYYGAAQFQKIFRTLVDEGRETIHARSPEEVDRELNRKGVEFVFLFQGGCEVQEQFRAVEDAERFYGLEQCEPWMLTEYWFAFDDGLNSWAMYDALTGVMRFTPRSALSEQGQNGVRPAPKTRLHAHPGVVYREISNTVY